MAQITLNSGNGNYSYSSPSTNSIDNTSFTGLNVDGDVFLNGNSVGVDYRLKKIELYLEIVNPNLKLEDRWTELKKLGEEYRKLEAHLLKKEQLWAAMKNS